jgi:hypothetical protein
MCMASSSTDRGCVGRIAESLCTGPGVAGGPCSGTAVGDCCSTDRNAGDGVRSVVDASIDEVVAVGEVDLDRSDAMQRFNSSSVAAVGSVLSRRSRVDLQLQLGLG